LIQTTQEKGDITQKVSKEKKGKKTKKTKKTKKKKKLLELDQPIDEVIQSWFERGDGISFGQNEEEQESENQGGEYDESRFSPPPPPFLIEQSSVQKRPFTPLKSNIQDDEQPPQLKQKTSYPNYQKKEFRQSNSVSPSSYMKRNSRQDEGYQREKRVSNNNNRSTSSFKNRQPPSPPSFKPQVETTRRKKRRTKSPPTRKKKFNMKTIQKMSPPKRSRSGGDDQELGYEAMRRMNDQVNQTKGRRRTSTQSLSSLVFDDDDDEEEEIGVGSMKNNVQPSSNERVDIQEEENDNLDLIDLANAFSGSEFEEEPLKPFENISNISINENVTPKT